jgi:phosphoribosyl 1,2-cyclic phosphate phosphodiesterase
MQALILGCGTSTGVPLPGCRCDVCRSKDPKNHRDRTSALVTLDNGRNILIDVSTDFRHQALRFDIPKIDAVLYTHAHADHILGTDDLRCYNFIQRERIPCYGTSVTLKHIRECFSYIFNPDPHWEGGLLAQLSHHEIDGITPFELFGQEIEPFELVHGRTVVTGFKFGPFAYATDCKTLPEATKQLLKGIPYLILDGLRYEPHPSHLSIDESIAIAQELKAEKNLSHPYDAHH